MKASAPGALGVLLTWFLCAGCSSGADDRATGTTIWWLNEASSSAVEGSPVAVEFLTDLETVGQPDFVAVLNLEVSGLSLLAAPAWLHAAWNGDSFLLFSFVPVAGPDGRRLVEWTAADSHNGRTRGYEIADRMVVSAANFPQLSSPRTGAGARNAIGLGWEAAAPGMSAALLPGSHILAGVAPPASLSFSARLDRASKVVVFEVRSENRTPLWFDVYGSFDFDNGPDSGFRRTVEQAEFDDSGIARVRVPIPEIGGGGFASSPLGWSIRRDRPALSPSTFQANRSRCRARVNKPRASFGCGLRSVPSPCSGLRCPRHGPRGSGPELPLPPSRFWLCRSWGAARVRRSRSPISRRCRGSPGPTGNALSRLFGGRCPTGGCWTLPRRGRGQTCGQSLPRGDLSATWSNSEQTWRDMIAPPAGRQCE